MDKYSSHLKIENEINSHKMMKVNSQDLHISSLDQSIGGNAHDQIDLVDNGQEKLSEPSFDHWTERMTNNDESFNQDAS